MVRPLLLFCFFVFSESPLFSQIGGATATWPEGGQFADWQPLTLFFADPSFEIKTDEALRHPKASLPKKNWLSEQVASARARYWLHFPVENPSATDTLRLVFSPGRHARSEAFLIKNGSVARSFGTAGWLNRAPNRPWAANIFGLGIELAPSERAELLVSVEDRYRFYDHLRSELYSPGGYTAAYHAQRSRMVPLLVFMCLVIGGLGLLALFAFAQFSLTGDRSLLWYCAYELAMVALYWHGLHYYLADFGRPWMPPYFWNKAHPLLQLLVSFLYVQFVFEFLNLRGRRGLGPQGIRWVCRLSGAMVLIFLPFPFLFDKIPPVWTPLPFAVSYFLLTAAPPFVLFCLLKTPGKLTIYPIIGTALLMVAALTAIVFLYRDNGLSQHETGLFDTNRFYAGICILLEAVVFALGLGHKTRVLFLEKQQAQKRLLDLRADVSQDLHDDLGSEISSMSIQSYNAARSGNPSAMTAALDGISERASRLVEDLRDIVWAMSPDNDAVPKLAHRMRAFAARLFDESEVRLGFDFGPGLDSLTLAPEARKQVYLFYKEAMANAARHAAATSVFVRMGAEAGRFFLEIKDDGRGFSPKTAQSPTGGNGLGNLQKRARALGGECEVLSKPGEGTVVRLRAGLG